LVIVVVEPGETILGFVEFSRADREASAKCGDLRGILAIAIEDGIVGLVEESSLGIGWSVAGNAFFDRNGKGFSIAMNVF